MTSYCVYVCDLSSVDKAKEDNVEPYDWDRKRASPYFPPLHPEAYWRVRELIDKVASKGDQITQLEWSLPATKAQLLRYVEEWYGADQTYGPESTMPWLRDKYEELKTYIIALDDEGEYALIADEF